MTDREKLIELFWGFKNEHPKSFANYEYSALADFLISHGVCIRGKGEWIDNGRDTEDRILISCPACGGDNRAYVYPNFCRWCGADMRGDVDAGS